jgi:transcriptional antiterminator NusG
MEKQWFVVHTLTGQESKVRDGIMKRVAIDEMTDYIGEVIIPTEKVSEVKRGVRTETTRKFFPGYVLVNIALYDENRQLVERTWHFIKETTGVIGFVGGERPVPLPEEEVQVVLNQVEEKKEKVAPKVTYEVGETIKITDGPFVNLSGTVDEIDPERGRLKVSVAIFDRLVSVELEYWQVERV